jgi:hypothetical protein
VFALEVNNANFGVALSIACRAAQATPDSGVIQTEMATAINVSPTNIPVLTTIYAPTKTEPAPCAPAKQ